MENKLEIKFGSQKQSFEILEEEILVDLKTAKHKLRYNVSLEDIKNNWHIINGSFDKNTNRLYASLFFNVFLILCIIVTQQNDAPPLATKIFYYLCLLPFVFLIIKNTQIHEEKHLESSKLFYFIYTKKNAEEVNKFIDLIFKKQSIFFRKKYFLVDPILPYTIQV